MHPMIIRLIIASTCTCLLMTSCLRYGDPEVLPSRADCIVRVYPDPSSGMRGVSPDMNDVYFAFRRLDYPLGGISYDRKGHLYLQFERNCESRGAMARSVMRNIYGESSSGFRYQEEGVRPGLDTISVSGDAWRD